MGKLTKEESQLLDKLVSDCIEYGLQPKEALVYIKREYHPPDGIGERTYFRRRKKLLSEQKRNSWFSHFTRIGFVTLHKRIMESLEKSYDDLMHQLFIEQRREKRNEMLVIKLKEQQMHLADMLSKLSLGTPILAGLSARLAKDDRGLESHFLSEIRRSPTSN